MKIPMLLLCCAVSLSLVASSGRCTIPELSQWIGSSLIQIEKIQVGMTRADVEKLFVSDGGISTLYRQTYVFRDCPYIKIDVEFAATEQNGRPSPEHSQDRITAVSKPYLAQPGAD